LFRADDKQKQQLSFSSLFKESSPGISLGMEHPNKFPEKEEVLFTRFDNTVFTAEVLHSCYLDYKGNPKYVVLIRDISFRKEMEQRLQDKEKMYQRKLTKEIILAQEREREAIGHEMHDNVNQILTSIKLFLEMSMKNPSLREELIPKSIGHIMECITEIRNLSRELSAPTLGTKSLIDSIKSLVETIEVSSGLVIYFEHDLYRIPLIKDQNLAIYRILQEQLNNIIKHAAATVVRIVLSQQENMTELIIRDNGKGFDINAKRKGIGLNNILSRTIVFDGEFEITSQPGKGTELRICLPVMQSEEEIDISLQQHQMAKQLNFF